MAKITGPALSLSASKTLGKLATFQKRPSGHAVYLHSKPGGRAPYTPTYQQRNQRIIIGLLTAQWQNMPQSQKDDWNTDAADFGSGISGYNLFVKKAQQNLPGEHGLQLYYSFNEQPRSSALDLSGNNVNGILKATYPTSCPQPVTVFQEKLGKSLEFGSNKYILNDTANLALNIRQAITLECFFYSLSNTSAAFIVGSSNGSYNLNFVSQKFYWSLKDIIGTRNTIVSATFTNRKKYHLACSFNFASSDKKGHIYIDGVEVASYFSQPALFSPLVDTQGKIYVGYPPPFSYFGYLDEVRVYSRALPPGEILKHAQMLLH